MGTSDVIGSVRLKVYRPSYLADARNAAWERPSGLPSPRSCLVAGRRACAGLGDRTACNMPTPAAAAAERSTGTSVLRSRTSLSRRATVDFACRSPAGRAGCEVLRAASNLSAAGASGKGSRLSGLSGPNRNALLTLPQRGLQSSVIGSVTHHRSTGLRRFDVGFDSNQRTLFLSHFARQPLQNASEWTRPTPPTSFRWSTPQMSAPI